MYRFLIVDDHPVTRRGIKELLSEAYPTSEITEARNAFELMHLASKGEWDVVITDISMPGRSGLEVVGDIKKEFPKLKVLILSMHAEEEYAIRAIKSGASGYMTKDNAIDDEFIKAVNLILQGRKYITTTIAERMALEISNEAVREPHELLSDREFEVFKLIGKGVPTGQISDKLALSVNTIGTFRRRILDKMHLKNNADIVRYAISHQLAD